MECHLPCFFLHGACVLGQGVDGVIWIPLTNVRLWFHFPGVANETLYKWKAPYKPCIVCCIFVKLPVCSCFLFFIFFFILYIYISCLFVLEPPDLGPQGRIPPHRSGTTASSPPASNAPGRRPTCGSPAEPPRTPCRRARRALLSEGAVKWRE